MIRVFKTRQFNRWAVKERVKDTQLRNMVREIQAGLIGADLGGGVIKKRLARKGQGKRGGHRAIIAFRKNDRVIFILGFSKNDKENMDQNEEDAAKILANCYLSASDFLLNKMTNEAKLIEVNYEAS